MDKNEIWSEELMAQYQRGKVITDAREADLTASREHVIRMAINELQARLDGYLKPKDASTSTR